MIKRTIFITRPCRLNTSNEQLIIKYNHLKGYEDEADKSIPIEDIAIVMLENQQISLTHPVLNKLIEYNVAVVSCNKQLHPTGMMLNLDGSSVQSERFRVQIEVSEPLKKQLWQQTVMAKINNQAHVLEEWNVETAYLTKIANNIKSGDKENGEAMAAVYYWQRLFPPTWNFYRKREGIPPNNLLNYGYAILRAATARSLVGSGLLPTFGIFHRNRYNAYCLADDIMEPYRPFIDSVIREIIHSTSEVETLSIDIKSKLLNTMSMDVFIDGKKSPLLVALQRTTASLANCYLGNQRRILYPTFA